LEREKYGEIFVDLNIRPPFYSKESVLFALENASIVKISDEEMPTVLKEIGFDVSEDYAAVAKALSARFENLKIIIVTLGSKGAFAYDCKTKENFSCDAVKVKAVSTVGAGDSFSASFLYKYLVGEDIEKCLAYAAKVAAFVVSKYEAVPSYSATDFN
ncbi:MAG: carbohydrate kinase family protein, partial [Clostridia bacterium]|nr:carbohydrate kinase family protein [Clostridia bacterium]